MKRDSMVFYRSFYEAIVNLPDVELAQAFRAIAEYGLNGIETECSGTARVALMMAKPQIDKNNMRYANGCKGGRPTENLKPNNNQTKPSDNQTITNPKPNVNDNDNVNVTRVFPSENTLETISLEELNRMGAMFELDGDIATFTTGKRMRVET